MLNKIIKTTKVIKVIEIIQIIKIIQMLKIFFTSASRTAQALPGLPGQPWGGSSQKFYQHFLHERAQDCPGSPGGAHEENAIKIFFMSVPRAARAALGKLIKKMLLPPYKTSWRASFLRSCRARVLARGGRVLYGSKTHPPRSFRRHNLPSTLTSMTDLN